MMMKLPPEIRESNPLDVLANVAQDKRRSYDAVLQLLSAALPQDLASSIPTIFNLGLGLLFVREIWRRDGYDADTNATFSVHGSVTRNSDFPGLTHLARAILGLGVCARWGCGIGPAESQLLQGLRQIADGHGEDASFWAIYVGAISSIIATVFPVMPKEPRHLLEALRFNTQITAGHKGTKNKIVLTIGLASEFTQGIDQEGLADNFQSAVCKKEDKSARKVSAQVSAL